MALAGQVERAGRGTRVRAAIGSVFATPAAFFEAERERWFNWVPVCFGAGIAAYFALGFEPSLAVAFAPLLAGIVLRALWRRETLAVVSASALAWAACGFFVAKLRTEWARAPVMAAQMRGVEVRGFVELVEPKPVKGQRLTIRVTQIGTMAPDQMPRRVRIRTMGTLAGVKPGDAVRVSATLGPPAGPALPGGFDFGRQAWYLGIGGNGYAFAAAAIDETAGPLPWQMWGTAAIERVRQRIGRAVVAGLAGETGGIANALITGERGGISAATDGAYRDSGLYHILSISGLHMVVMAGAFFFIVRFGFALVPPIALNYPIKKWAAVAAALGALGYLLISGGSFATVRSYVQISILFLAIMLERPALALRNVAIAAMALLVVWPESLFDAGFQMSFAAVVALISGYEAIRAREERLGRGSTERGRVVGMALFLAGIMGTTLIATLAVAPFAAYQFHTSQQYGAIANLVALPICDLFVMPAALATLLVMPLGWERIPLWFAGLGIDAMTWVAFAVAKLPGAVIAVVAIPVASFGLMVAGGLWLLLWQTRPRLLGLPLIAAGLALAPMLERPDVIVSRDGVLVAARLDGGRLAVLPAPRSLYDLARWLEADGDQRQARNVSAAGGFRCDGAGCTGLVKGRMLAVNRQASALAQDCARAYILVIDRPRPKGCAKPAVVVDWTAMRSQGTHAVYLNAHGGVPRVDTVAQLRGERPWSQPAPVVAHSRSRAPVTTATARLREFALPAALVARALWPSVEGDEDDPPPPGPSQVPGDSASSDPGDADEGSGREPQ